MARHTYRECKYCGDWHDIAAWPPNHRDAAPARSDLPAPYFISDTMDALFHPVDSRTYDSKSAFRAITEASGNIEMGNDTPRDTRYVDTVTPTEVAEAMHKVDQGYRPNAAQATAEETVDAL